jgi:hypothetical protein
MAMSAGLVQLTHGTMPNGVKLFLLAFLMDLLQHITELHLKLQNRGLDIDLFSHERRIQKRVRLYVFRL